MATRSMQRMSLTGRQREYAAFGCCHSVGGLVLVDGARPRTTAVPAYDFFGGAAECQIPFRFVHRLPSHRCRAQRRGVARAGVEQT